MFVLLVEVFPNIDFFLKAMLFVKGLRTFSPMVNMHLMYSNVDGWHEEIIPLLS